MNRTLEIRPAAAADFDEIWRLSRDRWGVVRADTYLDAIDKAIERIAVEPSEALRCDHIMPGYVRRRAGSHYVFAIVDDRHTVIVRVLHERMNFDAHLTDPHNP